ncbi:MAG: hypothetical protein ACRDU8_09975 [Egibacteraceae bacterium]
MSTLKTGILTVLAAIVLVVAGFGTGVGAAQPEPTSPEGAPRAAEAQAFRNMAQICTRNMQEMMPAMQEAMEGMGAMMEGMGGATDMESMMGADGDGEMNSMIRGGMGPMMQSMMNR